MLVKGITKEDLAKLLGKSKRAIENRLNGRTNFLFDEATLIKRTYFQEFSLGYLFSCEEYTIVDVNRIEKCIGA